METWRRSCQFLDEGLNAPLDLVSDLSDLLYGLTLRVPEFPVNDEEMVGFAIVGLGSVLSLDIRRISLLDTFRRIRIQRCRA